MILNSPYISGSLTVTGNTNLMGALTVTGSLAGTATSSSFAYTASSAVSAYTAASAVNATTALTASFATSFTVAGALTAQTLVVQTITSSVSFITGSTRFGSLLTNTHQFTGSLQITGSGPHYVFGNVGVGTASPVSSLHLNEVSGGITLSRTVSALSSSVGAIEWRNNHASSGVVWARIDAVTLGTSANPWDFSNITFSTWNGFNSLTERMRITNTGNVGIGTVSPSSQFHISGSTGGTFTDGLRINRNGNANQYTVINHVGGASNFITVDTSGNNIAEMYFQRSINGTAATSSMMINTNGNVGIGTASPNGRFEVANLSAGVTVGDFLVDATNKQVYVGRQSSTSGDNSYFTVRGRTGIQMLYVDTNSTGSVYTDGSMVINRLLTLNTGVKLPNGATTLTVYEEGTWTPAFAQAGTPSYTTQFGRYTRIGNMVYCTIALRATSISGGSTIQITGLPFSAGDASDTGQRATYSPRLGGHINGVTETTGKFRVTGGTTMEGVKGDGDTTFMTAAQFTSGGSVQITGQFWYYV